ncbi:MAG TPA: restriction endonuclease subunit S, partial [Rugosibacter sp.]|nr:restriction endonuclease subunit S [Rugosibacter sp.]
FEWKGNPSLLNQRVCRLQDFTGELIPKFIFYGINEYLKAIEDVTGFATVKHLSSKQVLDIDFPVPPLPEQQRIVAILDEAFAGIATARANAEQNRQNARALFESHLQSIFADAWQTGELVTLADLAIEITDGDHMPPPKALSGVPFITIGNIAKNTRTIDFTDTFMVSKEYFDRLKPNKKPQKGDVLYTVTGSFGIPVLLSEHRDFCFQRHIGLVRPKPEVNSEWLCHLLLSPQIFKQANDGATGTAQKTISLKLLRGYQVPRIPLALQHAVVTKLNTVSKETQRLESLYQQKIAALDELKKSLLHQAFSGAL